MVNAAAFSKIINRGVASRKIQKTYFNFSLEKVFYSNHC